MGSHFDWKIWMSNTCESLQVDCTTAGARFRSLIMTTIITITTPKGASG
jgi:hypothetical protein